jgi:hypothetical protein
MSRIVIAMKKELWTITELSQIGVSEIFLNYQMSIYLKLTHMQGVELAEIFLRNYIVMDIRTVECKERFPLRGTYKLTTPWSESGSELYRLSDRSLSRSDCQLLWIEGATWSAWRIPTAVFSVL